MYKHSVLKHAQSMHDVYYMLQGYVACNELCSIYTSLAVASCSQTFMSTSNSSNSNRMVIKDGIQYQCSTKRSWTEAIEHWGRLHWPPAAPPEHAYKVKSVLVQTAWEVMWNTQRSYGIILYTCTC